MVFLTCHAILKLACSEKIENGKAVAFKNTGAMNEFGKKLVKQLLNEGDQQMNSKTALDLGYEMFTYNARCKELIRDPVHERYPCFYSITAKMSVEITFRLQRRI